MIRTQVLTTFFSLCRAFYALGRNLTFATIDTSARSLQTIDLYAAKHLSLPPKWSFWRQTLAVKYLRMAANPYDRLT